ncbi:hypothetical protein KUV73_15425 [Mameliella alba]|nr:hypothetical protein [Mameliella alba]MBY6170750.1 hypothetical protein [Mameliella alba]MBY6175763.1 hypothetical protein [Mameliella alba]
MRVLIHPGFHKTGTTSLQRGADSQRRVLEPRVRLLLPHDMEQVNFAARRLSLGVVPKRVTALREALAGLASGIDSQDPRPLLISSEHLSGLMPGRKSVTGYDAAPEVLSHVVDVLSDHLTAASMTLWFTTRAPRPWLKSLYWQILRSQRLTEDLAGFSLRMQGAADHAAVVERVAARIGARAAVSATPLEACANGRLGPLGVALDRLGVSTVGLMPPDRQNVQPSDGVEALLALNRSDMDDAALGRAKTDLLKDVRRGGKTRKGG